MIVEMFKTCLKSCDRFYFTKSGALGLRGNCKDCPFRHEQIVFFGEEKEAELEFDDFRNFFNFIKKRSFDTRKHAYLDLTFLPTTTKKCKTIAFLQFCIENDIYKNYCIRELKKELEESFYD